MNEMNVWLKSEVRLYNMDVVYTYHKVDQDIVDDVRDVLNEAENQHVIPNSNNVYFITIANSNAGDFYKMRLSIELFNRLKNMLDLSRKSGSHDTMRINRGWHLRDLVYNEIKEQFDPRVCSIHNYVNPLIIFRSKVNNNVCYFQFLNNKVRVSYRGQWKNLHEDYDIELMLEWGDDLTVSFITMYILETMESFKLNNSTLTIHIPKPSNNHEYLAIIQALHARILALEQQQHISITRSMHS